MNPFLKWIGGKTKIMADIIETFPKHIHDYHEVFLGGGSVLLKVLSLKKSGELTVTGDVYAYDLNESLINVYKNIQTDPEKVYDYICKYMDTYDRHDTKEKYYYELRNIYNSKRKIGSYEASALFIVLNKLGFRGLYREGPNGFNVAYGHYKTTPAIPSKDQLMAISELISEVNFVCADCEDTLRSLISKKSSSSGNKDLVYLDPPYVPDGKNSFDRYTGAGFDLKKHEALFKQIDELGREGGETNIVLSNSNVKMVIEYFTREKNYRTKEVTQRRTINPKDPSVRTTEVIISKTDV